MDPESSTTPGLAALPPPPPPTSVPPEPWAARRGLTGWRGAIAVLAIALGLPVATAAARDDSAVPGAPLEVGGRVTVATVYGWEPVQLGETHAVWQLGASQIWVETGDFEGTSAELLGAIETDLRDAAVAFVTGDIETLPVFGFGALALHKPFVGTFPTEDTEVRGPGRPVEGLVAAMAADGRAVTFLAFAPEGAFAAVRDDIMATLSGIERIDQ